MIYSIFFPSDLFTNLFVLQLLHFDPSHQHCFRTWTFPSCTSGSKWRRASRLRIAPVTVITFYLKLWRFLCQPCWPLWAYFNGTMLSTDRIIGEKKRKLTKKGKMGRHPQRNCDFLWFALPFCRRGPLFLFRFSTVCDKNINTRLRMLHCGRGELQRINVCKDVFMPRIRGKEKD